MYNFNYLKCFIFLAVIKKNQYNKILKKFKKRGHLPKKAAPQLKFGQIGFFFKKDYRMEFVYISFLKRLFKKLNILKKKIKYFSKIWIFLNKNYPISVKSKNARMGKGKGSFLRWTMRIPRFFIFLEFADLDFLKLLKFKKKFKKKMSSPVYVKFSKYNTFPLWVNKSNTYFFINKYNLISKI